MKPVRQPQLSDESLSRFHKSSLKSNAGKNKRHSKEGKLEDEVLGVLNNIYLNKYHKIFKQHNFPHKKDIVNNLPLISPKLFPLGEIDQKFIPNSVINEAKEYQQRDEILKKKLLSEFEEQSKRRNPQLFMSKTHQKRMNQVRLCSPNPVHNLLKEEDYNFQMAPQYIHRIGNFNKSYYQEKYQSFLKTHKTKQKKDDSRYPSRWLSSSKKKDIVFITEKTNSPHSIDNTHNSDSESENDTYYKQKRNSNSKKFQVKFPSKKEQSKNSKYYQKIINVINRKIKGNSNRSLSQTKHRGQYNSVPFFKELPKIVTPIKDDKPNLNLKLQDVKKVQARQTSSCDKKPIHPKRSFKDFQSKLQLSISTSSERRRSFFLTYSEDKNHFNHRKPATPESPSSPSLIDDFVLDSKKKANFNFIGSREYNRNAVVAFLKKNNLLGSENKLNATTLQQELNFMEGLLKDNHSAVGKSAILHNYFNYKRNFPNSIFEHNDLKKMELHSNITMSPKSERKLEIIENKIQDLKYSIRTSSNFD